MPYGAFLAAVREYGEYGTQEAERITEAVISSLGWRLTPEAAEHLADQLPRPLAQLLEEAPARAHAWSAEEFVSRVADATGADRDMAYFHARAVLGTVGERISGGEFFTRPPRKRSSPLLPAGRGGR